MPLFTRIGRSALIAAVLGVLLGLTPAMLQATPAHAQTHRGLLRTACPPNDPEHLGCWDDVCPVEWGQTTLTITFASDNYAGRPYGWAAQACNAIAGSSDPNNQYVHINLAQPRPGAPVCVFGFTYGGYWLREHAPYHFTGQAQIAIRQDTTYDDPSLGSVACSSFEDAANNYNVTHGFNYVDDPTGAICGNCGRGGGSGGGGSGGSSGPPAGALPATGIPVTGLKAKRHVKKPLVCIYQNVGGKSIKTACHTQK